MVNVTQGFTPPPTGTTPTNINPTYIQFITPVHHLARIMLVLGFYRTWFFFRH
jgi:hypothetical protein